MLAPIDQHNSSFRNEDARDLEFDHSPHAQNALKHAQGTVMTAQLHRAGESKHWWGGGSHIGGHKGPA